VHVSGSWQPQREREFISQINGGLPDKAFAHRAGHLNGEVAGHADILATILARKSARMSVSVSVSMSVPWNSSLYPEACAEYFLS